MKYLRYKGKLYRAIDKSDSAAALGIKKEYDKLAAQWNAKVEALKKERAKMQKHLDNLSKQANKIEDRIGEEDDRLWDAYIEKYYALYPEMRGKGYTEKGLKEGKKAHPELLALYKKWQDFRKKNVGGAAAAQEIRTGTYGSIGDSIVEKTKLYQGWGHVDSILDKLKV